MTLLGTAVAPADHSKQEEPVVDLARQRPARVPLRGQREALKEIKEPDPVWTCGEYLAGILAPVRASRAEHVVTDHVFIIALSTHIVGDDVDPGLPEGPRHVPQP